MSRGDKIAQAGGPRQSLAKSAMVLLHGLRPLPPQLDPDAHAVAPSGYPLAPLDTPVRHLGVPVCGPDAECADAAFRGCGGKIVAAGLPWRPLRLNTIGRVHVAWQNPS